MLAIHFDFFDSRFRKGEIWCEIYICIGTDTFLSNFFLLGTSASSTDARRNVPGHNLLVQMGLVN